VAASYEAGLGREVFVMGTDAATKEQLGGKPLKGDSGDSKGKTQASSKTTENTEDKINPSAPGETGTTPGTNGKR